MSEFSLATISPHSKIVICGRKRTGKARLAQFLSYRLDAIIINLVEKENHSRSEVELLMVNKRKGVIAIVRHAIELSPKARTNVDYVFIPNATKTDFQTICKKWDFCWQDVEVVPSMVLDINQQQLYRYDI